MYLQFLRFTSHDHTILRGLQKHPDAFSADRSNVTDIKYTDITKEHLMCTYVPVTRLAPRESLQWGARSIRAPTVIGEMD